MDQERRRKKLKSPLKGGKSTYSDGEVREGLLRELPVVLREKPTEALRDVLNYAEAWSGTPTREDLIRDAAYGLGATAPGTLKSRSSAAPQKSPLSGGFSDRSRDRLRDSRAEEVATKYKTAEDKEEDYLLEVFEKRSKDLRSTFLSREEIIIYAEPTYDERKVWDSMPKTLPIGTEVWIKPGGSPPEWLVPQGSLRQRTRAAISYGEPPKLCEWARKALAEVISRLPNLTTVLLRFGIPSTEGTLYVRYDEGTHQRHLAVIKPDQSIRWSQSAPNTTKSWKSSLNPRRKGAFAKGNKALARFYTECKHLVRNLEHIYMLQADREIPVGLLQAFYESPAYLGTAVRKSASGRLGVSDVQKKPGDDEDDDDDDDDGDDEDSSSELGRAQRDLYPDSYYYSHWTSPAGEEPDFPME